MLILAMIVWNQKLNLLLHLGFFLHFWFQWQVRHNLYSWIFLQFTSIFPNHCFYAFIFISNFVHPIINIPAYVGLQILIRVLSDHHFNIHYHLQLLLHKYFYSNDRCENGCLFHRNVLYGNLLSTFILVSYSFLFSQIIHSTRALP